MIVKRNIASSYTSLRFYHRFFSEIKKSGLLKYIVSPEQTLFSIGILLFAHPDIRGLLSFLQQFNSLSNV